MKNLLNIADRVAKDLGLNPAVIKAICIKESAWNTWAVRYEPNWKWLLNPEMYAKKLNITAATETQLQMCSWGLMQVMGTVARELGFNESMPKMCQPENGILFGSMKLAACLKKYPALPDALASYNAGVPTSPVGKAYAQKIIEIIA